MKKFICALLILAGIASADDMCVVTFRIKQVTYTLSISEHLKNEANKQYLQIPVDCEFYNTLSVGQEIHGQFKMGSMFFNGDLSKLKVTVHEKKVMPRPGK